MRHFNFSLAAVALLIASPILALARIMGHYARETLALFRVDPLRMLTPGFGAPLAIGGDSLALDLQNSLRHEAGVPRYKAARNV